MHCSLQPLFNLLMDVIIDLLKITLPATISLYAIYLVIKAFIAKEVEKIQLQIKSDNQKIVLPIRLQAYERMCLYLERISFNNLIIRANDPTLNALQFQQKLLSEVRNEFNHNLSQQVYMSMQAWDLVKRATENTIMIINTSAELVKPEDRGIELAKKILENHVRSQTDAVNEALYSLKSELQTLF